VPIFTGASAAFIKEIKSEPIKIQVKMILAIMKIKKKYISKFFNRIESFKKLTRQEAFFHHFYNKGITAQTRHTPSRAQNAYYCFLKINVHQPHIEFYVIIGSVYSKNEWYFLFLKNRQKS
jgi:hypothetical protein